MASELPAVHERVLTERLEALRLELTMRIDATETAGVQNARDMNAAWLVTCGALVFFMQAGFAMLEAGIVHPKNVTNILFKNMIDASIAALCFWLLGYGFAYGEDQGGFIGGSNFACDEIYNNAGSDDSSDGWEGWFFQWAFTGACATIVAGSVAERTRLEAYFVYSIVLTTFIYPVVVHWGWGYGWLSAWGAYPDSEGNARPIFKRNEESNGMIDFAGSGVVHMVGGFSGLMGAIVVGPRKDRFDPVTGQANAVFEGNKTLQSLGVFILWFGWYGFNCGSTLAISGGAANVAGKVAMTTTIAAATACITASILGKITEGVFDVSIGLNGILAGLVSITANTSVVNPWMAFLIGIVGACILVGGHYLLLKLKIDDPCDACVVHGFCGVWGLWATGIFCTDKNVQYAAYPNENNACGRGEQFGVQVVASLAIIVWTCATAGMLFVGIHFGMGMRVSEDVEDAGLDASEHGLTAAYPLATERGGYAKPEQAVPVEAPRQPSPPPVNPQPSVFQNPQPVLQPLPPVQPGYQPGYQPMPPVQPGMQPGQPMQQPMLFPSPQPLVVSPQVEAGSYMPQPAPPAEPLPAATSPENTVTAAPAFGGILDLQDMDPSHVPDHEEVPVDMTREEAIYEGRQSA